MIVDLPAFLAVAAIVIVTPGSDTALVIRNVVASGRAAGIFTALGVATGQAIWTVASAAGLSALLVAWGGGMFASSLLLGALFCAMTLGWLSAYSFVVARAGRWLSRTGVRRAIDAILGATLLALGIRVGWTSR